MKFHDTLKPLYLDTDASGVRLGARLLKVRECMNCRHDEVPDHVTLYLIVFASKSLSSAEWQYSNIEQEALGISHWLKNISPLLFCQGGIYNIPEAIDGNVQ